jgi:PadR family transcriptional regulator, regulatory protein PadR
MEAPAGPLESPELPGPADRPDTPRLSRGDFGLLILGLLGRREMYGYEIVAELRATTEGAIDLPEGTVYPALRRMERDGLVEGHWVEVGGGAPRRRYYRLTLKGEHALADGRQEWLRFKAAADAVLAQ